MRPTSITRALMRAVPTMNAPVAALATSTRFGWLVTWNITMLTYTGRRSGRSYTIPVSYRRRGADVVIRVGMPDTKTWWRNFLDNRGPVSLTLDGADRSGSALASRDAKGGVKVAVRLTD